MERVQLDQSQEPVSQYLPLRHPEISQHLLVFSSCDAEEGLKEVNKAIPVDREEGDSVNLLSVTPHKSVKELVGRPSGIGPCANGEFDGGAQRENIILKCLIVTCACHTLLQWRGENSRWVGSLVQETGKGRAMAAHDGGDIVFGNGSGGG